MIMQGEELLGEAREFGPYWDWNSSGLRGETCDIMEEKVPMLKVYREFYEGWGEWSARSSEFIREVAGSRSNSSRRFKEITATTREMFRAHHSLMEKIRDGILSQLELVRTRVELLANER